MVACKKRISSLREINCMGFLRLQSFKTQIADDKLYQCIFFFTLLFPYLRFEHQSQSRDTYFNVQNNQICYND